MGFLVPVGEKVVFESYAYNFKYFSAKREILTIVSFACLRNLFFLSWSGAPTLAVPGLLLIFIHFCTNSSPLNYFFICQKYFARCNLKVKTKADSHLESLSLGAPNQFCGKWGAIVIYC